VLEVREMLFDNLSLLQFAHRGQLAYFRTFFAGGVLQHDTLQLHGNGKSQGQASDEELERENCIKVG